MRKALKFIAILLIPIIIAALALWPIGTFKLYDKAVFKTPRPRIQAAAALSPSASKIELLNTMFDRNNIYGERFLHWTKAELSLQEVQAQLKPVFEQLLEYGVISAEIVEKLEKASQAPSQCTVQANTDEMGFVQINLQVNLEDEPYKNIYNLDIELEPKSQKAVSVRLSFKAINEDLDINNYINYLGLSTLTDWQNKEINQTDKAKFSAEGQIYVHTQNMPTYGVSFGIFPMTEKDFLSIY